MSMSFALLVGLGSFLGAGTLAVVRAETGRRRWVVVGKPIATAALLLVAGAPAGAFGWLVSAGLLLSLAGDVALLGDGDAGFRAGVALFLGAHACYGAGFLGQAGPGVAGFALGAPVLVVSVVWLAKLWGGLGAMRLPVVAYAVAISAMVVLAFGTRGGPLPPAASLLARVGACFFYVSDAGHGWFRFRRPARHAPLVTLGVYWIGQLGIALAARLAAGAG